MKMLANLLAVVVVVGVAVVWTSNQQMERKHVPQGYMLSLYFDSGEFCWPHAFDFDGDWNPTNQRESYQAIENTPAPVVYHTLHTYDDFLVHQFAFYYAIDAMHEHDLERAYVFVRGDQPVVLTLSAHMWWNIYEVNSVAELTAVVELGKHAMGHRQADVSAESYHVFNNRGGRVITAAEFDIRDAEELDRDDLYDSENNLKTNLLGGAVESLRSRDEWLDPVLVLQRASNASYWLGRVRA